MFPNVLYATSTSGPADPLSSDYWCDASETFHVAVNPITAICNVANMETVFFGEISGKHDRFCIKLGKDFKPQGSAATSWQAFMGVRLNPGGNPGNALPVKETQVFFFY